jgi:hypothetical protein
MTAPVGLGGPTGCSQTVSAGPGVHHGLRSANLQHPLSAPLQWAPDPFFSTTAKQLTTADNAEPKENRRREPTPVSGFSQGKRYLDAAIKKTRAAGSDENWLKARANGLLAPARS